GAREDSSQVAKADRAVLFQFKSIGENPQRSLSYQSMLRFYRLWQPHGDETRCSDPLPSHLGPAWVEQDSNLRRQCHQIYSLAPLAAWVSTRIRVDAGRRVPVVFGRNQSSIALSDRVG